MTTDLRVKNGMDLAMIEGTEISDWPVSGWLLKLGIKWNGLSDGVPHRREDPDDATNALIGRLLMGSLGWTLKKPK